MSRAPAGRQQSALDGGVPGLYKICENCGRNFFRCIQSTRQTRHGGGANHCCKCREHLQGDNNQLWTCDECGTFRAWGQGAPAETVNKLLRCEHCSEVTPHEFWKVA